MLRRVILTSVDNPDEVGFGGKHVHLRLLAEGLKSLDPEPEEPPVEVLTDYLPASLNKMAGLEKFFYKRMRPEQKQAYLLKKRLAWYGHRPEPKPVLPGIIHAHDVVAGAGEHRKLPVILTLHGYYARETVNYNHYKQPEAVARRCLQVEYRALEKARHVIAVDSRIRDYVVGEFGYPAERVSVMHNAVHTQRFSPVDADRKRNLRESYGVPQDRFVVLIPRRLVRKNGVPVAAEALRQLAASGAYPYGVFLGSGPEAPALEAALAQVPQELWAWHQAVDHEIVHHWYQLADAIVVPSIRADGVEEATSLTMLEGMACGLPVICSDIGGMREVLTSRADTGILVEENDPEALATAIRGLMVDSPEALQSLGEAAREYVMARHSHIAHAHQCMQLYQRVLAN